MFPRRLNNNLKQNREFEKIKGKAIKDSVYVCFIQFPLNINFSSIFLVVWRKTLIIKLKKIELCRIRFKFHLRKHM